MDDVPSDQPCCCVCSKPGGQSQRLTSCISAPLHQELTTDIFRRELDEFGTLVPTNELHECVRRGRQGAAARKVFSSNHCSNRFHQTCLGRRSEASYDCNLLASRTTVDMETRAKVEELYLKDIRHLLCDSCLQVVQGNVETHYSGELDGEFCCLQDSMCTLISISTYLSISCLCRTNQASSRQTP